MTAIQPINLTLAEASLAEHLPDGVLTELLAGQGLPHRRVEAWRWSDLRATLKGARAASGPYNRDADESAHGFGTLTPFVVRIDNGELQTEEPLPEGLTFIAGEAAAPEAWPHAPVASLATARPSMTFTASGEVDRPLMIERRSSGDGAHADHLIINVAPGARLTLIERHAASGAPFANSLTRLKVGEGARVQRIIDQPPAPEAALVHTTFLELAAGTAFNQTTLAGGAGFARHETWVDHGADGSLTLDGVYRLDGTLHCDITTHVRHLGEGGVTRQLVKGIVSDRAQSVFQGKFHVEQAGQRTDAQMAHHALSLSGTATVNAKPELEIYADDVECAHGNTVGALDGEALFYLRQRGLDASQAQQLLVEAFLAEVMERIDDEDLRAATFPRGQQ